MLASHSTTFSSAATRFSEARTSPLDLQDVAPQTLALGLVQQRLQGLAQVGAQPRDARVGPARGVGERRRALALQNLGLDLAQRRRELRLRSAR